MADDLEKEDSAEPSSDDEVKLLRVIFRPFLSLHGNPGHNPVFVSSPGSAHTHPIQRCNPKMNSTSPPPLLEGSENSKVTAVGIRCIRISTYSTFFFPRRPNLHTQTVPTLRGKSAWRVQKVERKRQNQGRDAEQAPYCDYEKR